MCKTDIENTGGSSSSRDHVLGATAGDSLTRAVRKAIKSHEYHLGKLRKAAEELDGPPTQDARETSYTEDSGHRNLQEALDAPLVGSSSARATARSKAHTRPTAAKSEPRRRLQAQDSTASDRSDATMASAVTPPSLNGSIFLSPAVCGQIATIAQDLLVTAQDESWARERALFFSSTLSLAATSS